jgi:enediyne biosynthesis protein E4
LQHIDAPVRDPVHGKQRPAVTRSRARVVLGVAAVVTGAITVGAMTLARPPGAEPVGPPRFAEEAASAGIDHTYGGDFDYVVGGGVAVFDCDGDGRSELYLAGGSRPAALYRNRSDVGAPLRFIRDGDPAATLTAVTGAYPLDIDGDGTTDLAVLRHGENVLLRGLGDCRFERANELWGFDGGDRWTTAFAAKWEASAALPTLAFGRYLVNPDRLDPDHLCADNVLVRPGTDGRYQSAIGLTPSWCALSLLFTDWDRTGRRDLRVSNDRHYYSDYGGGEEQLWRVADGDPPRRYTRQDGWARLRIWGMGIASSDLTGDGYPEYFITSIGANKLETLEGTPERPTYHDIAIERRATAHRPYAGDVTLPSTAWHAQFEDVNNDGLSDLYVAKGNVNELPDTAIRDPSNLLLGQPDGTFVEGGQEAGIVSYYRGRGAALADLNLDGLLDLVLVNRNDRTMVWRNVGRGDASDPAPMGNWLAVRLRQPGPNVDAIGAWIEVRSGGKVMRRELTVGGGHAGGQLGWSHFGLGEATQAEARVQWPDGELGPWLPIAVDQFAIIERGASGVRPWQPG